MIPFFSVCIVVRDRPVFLVQAVRSVLANNFDDFEVIVVDDGSREPVTRVLELAGVADNKHLRIIRQEPCGISAARNAALAAAQGEFVVVLDSDDELLPDALDRLAARLMQSGCDWVYVDYEEVLRGSRRPINLPSYPSPEKLYWAILTRPRLPFKHSGMTIRRDVLLAIGGYDESLLIKVDVELMLRALHHGLYPQHLDHLVVRFHRHHGNVSRQRLLGIKTWMLLIDRYGPQRQRGRRMVVKAVRAAWELGKLLVRAGG